MSTRPWVVAVLAMTMTGGLLAGCGTGSDNPPTSASGTSPQQLEKSCDADARMNAGLNGLMVNTEALQTDDYDAAEVARVLPKIQTDFDRLVAPALTDLRDDPPAEIGEDTNELVAALKQFRDQGDTSVLDGLEELLAATAAFYFENCEGTKVEISGTDYAFTDPSTVTAGQARVKFTNGGSEFHHVVIFTKDAGVKESFDQLLARPDDQSEDKMRPITGIGPVAPGRSMYLTATFVPGDYAMVCFISQGATPEKLGSGAEMFSENGTSHVDLGMKKEFTVS